MQRLGLTIDRIYVRYVEQDYETRRRQRRLKFKQALRRWFMPWGRAKKRKPTLEREIAADAKLFKEAF